MLKNSFDDVRILSEKLNGIYRGVVEDNNPTDKDGNYYKDGRIRVRVFGLHTPEKEVTDTEGIPTSELPLAEPVCSLVEGSISGYGLWSIPVQGSHVMVFFENGNIDQMRYFATVPGIPTESPDGDTGFNDPDEVYPVEGKLNESDYHRLARGTKDTVSSPAYAAEYPHNLVLATHGGIIIEIDSTPGSERIDVWHPSGTYVEMDASGNKTESIKGYWDVTVSGVCNITVTGDCTVTAPNVITDGGYTKLSRDQGTLRKLIDERFIAIFNSHTHSGVEPGNGNTEEPIGAYEISEDNHTTTYTTAT